MMYRYAAIASLAVTLTLVATNTFALGPAVGSAGMVQGKVRDINLQQGLIVLQGGTELRANDVHQLDGLTPGMEIKVFYDESFGRKVINRLERMTPPSAGR